MRRRKWGVWEILGKKDNSFYLIFLCFLGELFENLGSFVGL